MDTIRFNDDWICNGEPVTLPHDAQITEKRGENTSNGGHGYFPGGIYTYEKTFVAPLEWKKKDVLIEFEGIYKNAAVSLNGKKLCFHAYGYTGFFAELTDLKLGAENTLTVVADNSKLPNSRWYSGSGIYRPVWLHVCKKGGLRPESVKISTVTYDPAVVRIVSPVLVKAKVGNVSGEGTDFELTIPNAKLWSDETPYLYTAKIMAGENDSMEIPFGIRKIDWSNKGLFINGKETLLRGGCIHHDGGILGAATYAESEYRRVRILKENGFNAIRSAHNPASKALLEACDRLGVYVMDESFDMWYERKSSYDYGCDWAENWEKDVTAMVERDFNLPSVILYSIGNEVSEPHNQKGIDSIDTDNYSVWGASAGGHLAASFGTLEMGYAHYGLPKPGAIILSYPVISMDKAVTHIPTHNNLLGRHATAEQEEVVSIERHITADYPPSFLWCGDADTVVSPENTERMAEVLNKMGVKHQFMVFSGVPHGAGCANGTSAEGWIDQAVQFWRSANGKDELTSENSACYNPQKHSREDASQWQRNTSFPTTSLTSSRWRQLSKPLRFCQKRRASARSLSQSCARRRAFPERASISTIKAWKTSCTRSCRKGLRISFPRFMTVTIRQRRAIFGRRSSSFS